MPTTWLKFWETDPGIPVEEFTDEENQALTGSITNTDSNVFAWKLSPQLTPEQIGALLSRYSRTIFTGKKLFLREFLPNKDRGREFFESWLVDYGDDSIQEMANGFAVSSEFISTLAAKEIEDNRLGSYIEKSTRYVAFDKKLPNGEYMFYKDPDILQSPHGDRYLELMRSLFDSYSKYIEAMMKYISDLNPFDAQTFRIGEMIIRPSELTAQIVEQFGIIENDLKRAYDNAVKANALDLMRDYLPLSTLTHVGISMNARSYENLCLKLLSSPLAECRWIGRQVYTELNKLVPSLIKRVPERHGLAFQEFLKTRNDNSLALTNQLLSKIQESKVKDSVNLIGYSGKYRGNKSDQVAQIILAATILYRYGHGHSISQMITLARKMSVQQRHDIISAYVGERNNRRHKPGRAFESVEYLFDLKGRIGIFRDIQRHRIGTQERQNFTTKLGFNTRKEFKEIGINDDYKTKMHEVTELFNKLHRTLPFQAQYAVTFGFDTRWYYRMNARQLFHLCELRTTPGGHPDYRKLVQDMFHAVQKVHPTVANHMKFVDLNDRPLGRLESEIRIAVKKKALGVTQQ